MKIYVCSKEIANNSQTKTDRSGIEAALRLKKLIRDLSITFVCLGTTHAMTQIREAISLGCDDAILLSYPEDTIPDAYASAVILSSYLKDLTYDAVFASCFAVDPDAIQTGLLLAHMLKLPSASYVEEIRPDQNAANLPCLTVKRQYEDCSCQLRLPIPCLISALPRPNQPFYMSAMEIARAYRTEIPIISTERLLEQNGFPPISQLIKVHRHNSIETHQKTRGKVLTVSTEEAIQAILDTMTKHHLLGHLQSGRSIIHES